MMQPSTSEPTTLAPGNNQSRGRQPTDSPPGSRPLLVSESHPRTMGRVFFVFAGNALAMFLGLLGTLWTMRVLGPEQFGIVSVSLVILYVTWQFTGKGLDQTALRLAAITDLPHGSAAIWETVFALKLVGNGALVLLGVILAGPLTHWLLGADTSPVPVLIGFLGATAASFWGLHSSAIQAESRFDRYAPVQVANNALKLLTLALIIFTGFLTATTAMITSLIGFFGAAVIAFLLAPNYARRAGWTREVVAPVLRYARWLVISSILFVLYSRLDLLMVSRMVGGETVGVYAAAALLAQMADLIGGSILTVFLPRFSRHTHTAPLREQVGASLRCSLLFAVPLVPCYILIEPVMKLLLNLIGPSYAGAVPYLKIMYFGVLFTMVTYPLHVLYFARGKPQIVTALDAFMLLFNAVGLYWGISWYGAYGAAVIVLVSRILAGTLLSIGVITNLGIGRKPTDG